MHVNGKFHVRRQMPALGIFATPAFQIRNDRKGPGVACELRYDGWFCSCARVGGRLAGHLGRPATNFRKLPLGNSCVRSDRLANVQWVSGVVAAGQGRKPAAHDTADERTRRPAMVVGRSRSSEVEVSHAPAHVHRRRRRRVAGHPPAAVYARPESPLVAAMIREAVGRPAASPAVPQSAGGASRPGWSGARPETGSSGRSAGGGLVWPRPRRGRLRLPRRRHGEQGEDRDEAHGQPQAHARLARAGEPAADSGQGTESGEHSSHGTPPVHDRRNLGAEQPR